MELSIVIGFKNREIQRVRHALDSLKNQTCQHFEVLFVDYGSDENVSAELKTVLRDYPFVGYIFNDTRGKLWNRSHALNTGIRLSEGDKLLLSDIDVCFAPDFVEKTLLLNTDSSFYTFNAYYLNEGDLPNFTTKTYPRAYIGVCLLKTSLAKEIRGYDEFYQAWGVEDDDFYRRLSNAGLKRIHLSDESYQMYHQWHPLHSPTKPSAWLITMVNYCQTNTYGKSNEIYGEILDSKDRSKHLNEKFNEEIVLESRAAIAFLNFWRVLHKMKAGETAGFNYRSIQYSSGKLARIVGLINRVLDKQKPFKYRLFNSSVVDSGNAISYSDIVDFIHFFIGTNRQYIADYNLSITDGSISLVFEKKASLISNK